jgi:hypothetical protein
MSQLIGPVLTAMQAVVTGASLGTLKGFATVQIGEAVAINTPCAFVLPVRTGFPNRGEGSARNQVHTITVRMCITGSDPVQLAADCLAYVQAVDAAINDSPASAWPDYVLYVFVAELDYGGMYSKGGGIAYWPEIHCSIEVEEIV